MTLEDMQTITAMLDKIISHVQIMAVLTEIKRDVLSIKMELACRANDAAIQQQTDILGASTGELEAAIAANQPSVIKPPQ